MIWTLLDVYSVASKLISYICIAIKLHWLANAWKVVTSLKRKSYMITTTYIFFHELYKTLHLTITVITTYYTLIKQKTLCKKNYLAIAQLLQRPHLPGNQYNV